MFQRVKSHFCEIGFATETEAKCALYKILFREYEREGLEDTAAAKLAAAVTNKVFGEQPTGDVGKAFAAENQELIETRARKLASDDRLCAVLSGAAYNVCYARYVSAGGSQGMFSNHFLTYTRALTRVTEGQMRFAIDSDYDAIWRKTRMRVWELDSGILDPIESMVSLGIFRPLPDNPDGRSYYDAVHEFAVAAGVPFRSSK